MKKGLILITAVWVLITLASCSNMLEDLRKAKNKRNAKKQNDFVKVEGSTVVGDDKFIYSNAPDSSDEFKGVFRKGRTVEIGTFYMCDHEVTQEEYEKYCLYGDDDYNPAYKDGKYGKGAHYPAYYVSWYDAVIYCNLRSEAEGLTPVYYIVDADGKKITNMYEWRETLGANDSIIKMAENEGVTKYCFAGIGSTSSLNYTGNDDKDGGIRFDKTANGYRLPTEAEWEYAALGGKNGVALDNPTDWAGTNNENEFNEYAWYIFNCGDNESDWYHNGKIHEVKGRKKNSLSLYDMSGNVWEWCWDWYDDSMNKPSITADTPDTGVVSGSCRVKRGGGCLHDATYCSVAYRSSNGPEDRSFIGFRVVRSAQ